MDRVGGGDEGQEQESQRTAVLMRASWRSEQGGPSAPRTEWEEGQSPSCEQEKDGASVKASNGSQSRAQRPKERYERKWLNMSSNDMNGHRLLPLTLCLLYTSPLPPAQLAMLPPSHPSSRLLTTGWA